MPSKADLFWRRVHARASALVPESTRDFLRAFDVLRANLTGRQIEAWIAAGEVDRVIAYALTDADFATAFSGYRARIQLVTRDAVAYFGKDIPGNALQVTQLFKPAKTIQEAIAYAKSRGVTITVGERISDRTALSIANKANEGLFRVMATHGATTDKFEIVRRGATKAPGTFSGGALQHKLMLNADSSLWKKGSDAQKLDNVVHELGHAAHWKGSYKKFADDSYNSFFYGTYQQSIAGQVSNYAKKAPQEFVAETFKGLVKGETYSEEVMTRYKELGGPVVNVPSAPAIAPKTSVVKVPSARAIPLKNVDIVGTTFGYLNPRVVSAVRQLDTKMMQTLATDTRQTVRDIIQKGLESGAGPRQTARALRDVLELAPNQLAAVQNYRDALVAGDKGKALGYELRDKRFDGITKRGALTPAHVDKL